MSHRDAEGGSDGDESQLDHMIEQSGAEVKPMPKAATQEGNVMLKFPDGTSTNVRVESHPLPGSKGNPWNTQTSKASNRGHVANP